MTSPSLACHQARGLGATRGAARSHDLALGALAAGATLPLGILGPGRVLDDWYTLFWAWSLGRTHAAGPTQGRSRPLGALVYDVQFGLIGDHPRVWWALQALIAIATTLLLRRLIAHFAPPAVATAVAGVWILSANHSTLDSWASGSLAGLSLLLLVGGAVALLKASAARRVGLLGCALLTASPLVYEATLPVAGLAATLLPWLVWRRDTWRHVAIRGAPLVAVTIWLVTGSYHLRHDQGWFSFGSGPDALFGQGIARWSGPAAVLLPIGVGWVVLAVTRPLSPVLRALIDPRAATLATQGAVVACVGYAAFARYPISAIGVGDRANVVSAIGGAMAWVGLGWAMVIRRRQLVVLAVPFAVLLGCARLARAADWHNAGRDSETTLAQVLPRFDTEPKQTFLVVGPVPRGHQGIVGLLGTIDPAVQLRRHDLGIRATVIVHPQDWDTVDPARRVTLRGGR